MDCRDDFSFSEHELDPEAMRMITEIFDSLALGKQGQMSHWSGPWTPAELFSTPALDTNPTQRELPADWKPSRVPDTLRDMIEGDHE